MALLSRISKVHFVMVVSVIINSARVMAAKSPLKKMFISLGNVARARWTALHWHLRLNVTVLRSVTRMTMTGPLSSVLVMRLAAGTSLRFLLKLLVNALRQVKVVVVRTMNRDAT